MDITAANLDIIFRDAQQTFQSALEKTPVVYPEISTTLPMGTRQTTQAFLDRVPMMRKWLGERVINNAVAHSRTITAEPYEDTLSLDKFDIEDDQLGLFSMGVSMLAEAGQKWPDQLVARYIKEEASVVNGYDGVPFFSTAHPILGGVAGSPPAGAPATQSNLAVNTALTYDNYVTARQNMRSWLGADGAPIMAQPDVLMVPPQLEGTAKLILEADFLANIQAVSTAPQSNVYKGSAKLIVNPWLADFPVNWWLLDCSKAIKPFIFYQRSAPTLTALVNPSDPNVFMNHKFIWGLESRGNSSESVWWLAYAATANATYIPA